MTARKSALKALRIHVSGVLFRFLVYAALELMMELCRRRAIGPEGGLQWAGGIPAGLVMGAAGYEAHARFTFRGLRFRVGLLEGLVRIQAFYWAGLLLYAIALHLAIWADASLACYTLATYPVIRRYVFNPAAKGLASGRQNHSHSR